ncbi:MAG: polymerase, sigma-24 subunit, subfamily [Acidobacteria bacterium]|nr:polymerase, sigma-24 subunit, subfamily [Acidobacteriota bacterium]
MAAERDGELVRAARGGDRRAFGLLYERHARMVHGVLLARVAWEEADDLLQDVFVAALERLHTLRDEGAFAPWLAAIARNRASDHHRRNPPLERVAPEDLPSNDRGPSAEALAALSAIQALPAAYRETLTLRLVEGMTGPEIAARTGLTPRSVRVNLHRGMKRLRERLASKQGER